MQQRRRLMCIQMSSMSMETKLTRLRCREWQRGGPNHEKAILNASASGLYAWRRHPPCVHVRNGPALGLVHSDITDDDCALSLNYTTAGSCLVTSVSISRIRETSFPEFVRDEITLNKAQWSYNCLVATDVVASSLSSQNLWWIPLHRFRCFDDGFSV